MRDKKEKNEESYLEITQGNAYLKIPKDIETIVLMRKMLEVYEKELSELDDLDQSKLPDLKNPIEDNDEEAGNKKDNEVFKSFDIPKIQPKEEVFVPNDQELKLCPLCNSKLKKKKIKREGDVLKQVVKCKKWSCPFEKEFVFNV